MNCHIVPKAYLKSWKKSGLPLFTFPKDELNSKGESHSLEMKGTSLAKTNWYILKPETCCRILEYKSEFVSLFEHIKKYNIEYNGNYIRDIEGFVWLYPYINDWKITDDSDNRMSNSKIKSELERIWEKQTQKSIENYFNRAIEDKWNNLLSYVKAHVLSPEAPVPAYHRDTLIEFMAIQMSRVYEHIDCYGIRPAIQILESIIMQSEISELPEWLAIGIHETLHSKDTRNNLCQTQLYRYIKAKESNTSSCPNNTVSVMTSILHPMQTIMLVADGESSFITSDCPCYPILVNGHWPTEVNGIYLPICPKVCVLFVEVQKYTDQYLITRIPDSMVNYINYMTAKNCVECVVYSYDTIQNMISEIPRLDLWDHSLRQVGLTCIKSI